MSVTDSIPTDKSAVDLFGREFDHHHAAGVTRYRVLRGHRDSGYYECVAVMGVSGTHHFVGSIQVFSRTDIESALGQAEQH